jgi:UDP-glucuronate 4-epimerase
MKILITGCAGFIGSHLCEKLLKDTVYDIYGIDNINDYYNINIKLNNLSILKKYDKFHFEKDDIVTTKIISKIKPNIVINLAAMAGVRYSLSNPCLYIKNNVEGQTNLLNQCILNNVKLFIYASSSSVYGTNKKVPFSENDDIKNVNSPYAASKLNCEIMAKLYSKLYNLNTIGLRFFTVYGPRGRPDMAPYKFLTNIMNNKKFDKFGSGNSYRDYTYIDDIVSGIIGAIKNKNNKKCEVYNLGNSNIVSLNEFIETCEKVTNQKAIYNQLDDQTGDVPITYSDINKAKNDLDYCPSTLLHEGLTKMYNWLLNN